MKSDSLREYCMQEALRRGIGKSTLHYLKRNAAQERTFKIRKKVQLKLGIVNAD